MKKVSKISGFPEWLPEERLIEQSILDTIRAKFELFGFAPIETRAVEPLEHLLAKGETDKEIYVLRRLQADPNESDTNLGLHFDLTIPFARYVLQFRNQLQFPMKRYQIQKVWRGERPQEGRYREFYQADIDVIAENNLPLFFDAEMPLLLHEVLSSLPISPIQICINNRKIMQGFYQGLGIDDIHGVLRSIDKLNKIGEKGVFSLLVDELKVPEQSACKCLKLACIRSTDTSFCDRVRELGVTSELLEQGLNELTYVMDTLKDLPQGSVVADLRIARGFDYYTGTIYEGYFLDKESFGAVCSGGRYDNLVSSHDETLKMPGVGVSIGVSRILGYLFAEGKLKASRKTPSCVLVALTLKEARPEANRVARALRSRGICCEVFHEPLKYGKQIKYAEKKGIPYVWFPEAEGSGQHEVRDIRSGQQQPADPETWMPPERDLKVQFTLQT